MCRPLARERFGYLSTLVSSNCPSSSKYSICTKLSLAAALTSTLPSRNTVVLPTAKQSPVQIIKLLPNRLNTVAILLTIVGLYRAISTILSTPGECVTLALRNESQLYGGSEESSRTMLPLLPLNQPHKHLPVEVIDYQVEYGIASE